MNTEYKEYKAILARIAPHIIGGQARQQCNQKREAKQKAQLRAQQRLIARKIREYQERHGVEFEIQAGEK